MWTNECRSLRGERVIASSGLSQALYVRHYTANSSLSFPSANTLMLILIYTHGRSITAVSPRLSKLSGIDYSPLAKEKQDQKKKVNMI